MTIPTCTITGSIFDLLDSDDDGAIEAVALEDVNVTFTPNTKGQLVAIGDVLYRPEPVTVTVDAAGKINGNAGVTLLANDESLDLEIPLQWRVSFTDLPTGGFTKDIRPFWFEAPEDGQTATLAELAAVPGTTATGFTKGDKGDTGPQGAAATISVGTVTTGAAGSSASVTNAGSSGAAVFNFTIPRGDTGPAASWTNVTDKPAVIAAGATQAEARTAIGAEASANKGAANGYASLDASALVPSTQLPSYVDDVLEYANLAAFPATGEANKIYIAANTGRSYRWSGSVYAEIVASPGTTDNITEGSTNLWFTNARADGRVAPATAAASDKATPVDADVVPLVDSAASNVLKKLSWANIKATFAAYYDALATTLSNKTIVSPALTGTTSVATGGAVDLYNVGSSGATNFERLRVNWDSDSCYVFTGNGGSGVLRSLRVGTGLNQHLLIQPSGNSAGTIRAVVSTATNNATQFAVGGTLSSTSGIQYGATINSTINQSSSGSYTALLINPTETATGSGAKRLIDAQVGGTTQFNVGNTGNVFVNGTLDLGNASDTTISRSSAGVIAVEGVTVPLNATTNTHTAQQIELGHATDTTITRTSAGMVAVEGNPLAVRVAVPATTGSTGASAQWAADNDWLYICTATDTWRRVALGTW